MENNCKIVQDLLPTYIENLTSEETSSFVEEHLNTCQSCKEIFEDMKELIEKEDIQNTEIVKNIKKYKTRITLIKLTLVIIIISLISAIFGYVGYRFYIVKKAYEKNTNYEAYNNFTFEEFEDSIERYDKHYTTYCKNDVMKKYYGNDCVEYYDGKNHYYFNNENMTYWVSDKSVNTSLNINISLIDGMQNIIKDNKINNWEILKFVIFTKNLEIYERGFRDKTYNVIICNDIYIFLDQDTFFVERIENRNLDLPEKYTEYRTMTSNVTYREISEPDFSKYTLIEK